MMTFKKTFFLFFLALGVCNSYAGQGSETRRSFNFSDITLESSLSKFKTIYGIDIKIKGYLPSINISTGLVNATVDQALRQMLKDAGIKNSYFVIDNNNKVVLLRLLNNNIEKAGYVQSRNNLPTFLQKTPFNDLQDSLNPDENSKNNPSDILSFEQLEVLKINSDASKSSSNREFELLSEEHKAILSSDRFDDMATDSDNLTQIQIDKLRQMNVDELSDSHSLTQEQIKALKQINQDIIL